jgi:hypothetical protein
MQHKRKENENMGRKKITTEEVLEGDELGKEAPEEKTSGPEQELQDYIKSLGESNLAVKIFKQKIGQSAYTYMTVTTVDQATEEYIQENFGAGTYQVRCFLNGKYVGAKTIQIGEGPKKPEILPNPNGDESEIPAQSLPYSDPVLLQIEMMRESAVTNRELLKALIEKSGSEKSSTMELAQIMAMFKTMQPAAETGNPMKMFSELLPFVRELMKMMGGNPPEEEEGGWRGILKGVIKEVPGMLNMLRPNGASTAPNNASTTGAVLTEGAIPLAIAPEMLKQLQWAFGFLKGRCRVGADPLAFVDFAMNTLDTEQSMNVVQLLDRSYEEIATIDPDLLNAVYRPWFEVFFKGLKDAILERNATAGSQSDGNDVATDERINAARVPK